MSWSSTLWLSNNLVRFSNVVNDNILFNTCIKKYWKCNHLLLLFNCILYYKYNLLILKNSLLMSAFQGLLNRFAIWAYCTVPTFFTVVFYIQPVSLLNLALKLKLNYNSQSTADYAWADWDNLWNSLVVQISCSQWAFTSLG